MVLHTSTHTLICMSVCVCARLYIDICKFLHIRVKILDRSAIQTSLISFLFFFLIVLIFFPFPYFHLILCRANANLPILANATPFIGKLNVLIYFHFLPHMCLLVRVYASLSVWVPMFVCMHVCLSACLPVRYPISFFKLCFHLSSLFCLFPFRSHSHCFCNEISAIWVVDQRNERSQSVQSHSIGMHFSNDWNQLKILNKTTIFWPSNFWATSINMLRMSRPTQRLKFSCNRKVTLSQNPW